MDAFSAPGTPPSAAAGGRPSKAAAAALDGAFVALLIRSGLASYLQAFHEAGVCTVADVSGISEACFEWAHSLQCCII